MTIPHCTGCTEPGEVTHSMETVEHIHDACHQWREGLEQLQVQLAGTLTAADGATHDPAVEGQYGWSVAYQRVLDLRLRHDAMETELNDARVELADLNTLFDLEHDRMVEAMKRWQAVDPTDRALKSPDLGALLDFIHDELTEANATIAALREALGVIIKEYGHVCEEFSECDHPACESSYGAWAVADEALRQPLPPAAAKLLAERDAGRALFEAVRESGGSYGPEVWQAVEAYRKVVEG